MMGLNGHGRTVVSTVELDGGDDVLGWVDFAIDSDLVTLRGLAKAIDENHGTLSHVLRNNAGDETRDRIVGKLRRVREDMELSRDPNSGVGIESLIEAYPYSRRGGSESAVTWWKRRAKSEGLSSSQVAKEVGYDASVVSRAFRGVYEGSEAAIEAAFGASRDRILGPSGGAVVATGTREILWETLDDSRGSEFVSVVYGDPGIGKSQTLREYVERANSGLRDVAVVLITADENATSASLMHQVAEAMGLAHPRKESASDLIQRVWRGVGNRRPMLVIDECNNLARASYADKAAKTLNALRQLNDVMRGGLVLCGTLNLFDLVYSPRNVDHMEMIRSRVGIEVKLPGASLREVRALLTAYFGGVDEETWKVFLGAFEGDKEVGMGCRGTGYPLRRAALFVRQAQRVLAINEESVSGPLTPGVVRQAWTRSRRRS